MKTNHQRNFKETYRDYSAGPIRTKTTLAVNCELSGVCVTPKHPGFDFSNGHRGKAKAKAGAKKFVRSRSRFHENAATKKLAKQADI